MITEKRKIGNKGESLACRFLEINKYSIVERNFLTKYGEIDIIAKKGNSIHFIEVKSISRESPNKLSREPNYRPEENVHPEKLRRLSRTIQIYFSANNIDQENMDWQFDVITVTIYEKNKIAKIKFIKDVVI